MSVMSRSRLVTFAVSALIFAFFPASAAPQNATFSLKNTSTKVYATAVLTADLNGDGVPDLIETYARINPPAVFAVQLGLGNGYFAPAVDYNAVINQQYAIQVVTADVNKDGKADVIAVTGQDLLVYLGRGDGTFLSPKHYTLPTFAAYAAVADFNRDGNPDLVFSNSQGVSIAYGDGHGAFTAPSSAMTITSNQSIEALAVGDFDSDANADIAVAVTNGPCSPGGCTTSDVHILYGNGAGSFVDKLVYSTANDISFSSGDLNNDGKTDLVIDLSKATAAGQNLVVLYGQSSRTVTPTFLTANGYYVPPAPFAIADFNGDGHNDLAVQTQNLSNQFVIDLFLGSNSGAFTLQEIVVGTPPPPDRGPVLVGDFNRDHRPDLLFTSSDNSDSIFQVFDYMNLTTTGSWTPCLCPNGPAGIDICVFRTGTSGETVHLEAAASWFEPLRKLELWVDGVKVTEQYNVWDKYAWLGYAQTWGSGTHHADFFSAGYDNALQHKLVTFTVPGPVCSVPAAPGVHVCSPASGSSVTSPIHTLAGGKVTGTILRMEVWADSTKLYSTFGSSQLDATVGVPPGQHTLTYYIVNTAGTKWMKAVNVTVR